MNITIVSIDDSVERPKSHTLSEYEDWGALDPKAKPADLVRWLIVLSEDGDEVPVGDMSAHPIYYGPNAGSRAMNIGISVVDSYQGRGIGAIAQRLLAEELHAQGVVRVEASTDVKNIAEQRALAKAGFECEGILRSAQDRADGRHDLQVWSHIIGD